MGIVADPQNLVSYTVDMFQRIMNILLDAIQFFETLILNLPGIKDLCPLIKLILEDILKPLVAPILNAIVDGINIIIGILDYLFGAGIDKISNLNIPQSVVCNPQDQAPRPYEPTPCSTISDCTGSSAYCYISHPNECAEGTSQGQWNYVEVGGYRAAEEWAQPCLCEQTKGGDFFCNYASGFCQYGISYFGDPLMQCPVGTPADLQSSVQTMSANPFGEDTVYYNSMCWILPVYECQPANNGVLSMQQMQACIQGMLNSQKVQGPFLCRDFCNPSPYNTDNQLYQDATFGCVCLVGVGVGMGTGAPPYVPDFATIGRRRALLGSATSDQFGAYTNATLESITYVERYMSGTFVSQALPSAGGPTHCSRVQQCEAPEAVCRRHDGTLGPCEACPLRYSVEDFTGFTCASAKCMCVSPPPPGNPGVSTVDWVGFSKCAIVGRAYQNRTDLTALEYVTLRDCTKLHRFGQFLGIVTGVPLDPAVAYDVGAAALAFSHLLGGVVVANVYPDADDAVLRTHMREAGVDPAVYLGLRKPTLNALRRVADEFPAAADLARTTARAGFKFARTVNNAPRAADLRLAFTMAADGARAAAETAAAAARRAAAAAVYGTVIDATSRSDAAERTRALLRDAAADAAAIEAAGENMRATARRLQSLPATTCWVLSEARSVALNVIANIQKQYVYNGARAVCIFLQRSNCPQRYEDYYKATTPSPPPPPHPPPYHAPPPKPPASPPAVVPAYPHLKTLQSAILSGVGGLAGVDLNAALNTWVQKILTYSPANPAVVQQSLTEVTRVLQCDYNASPFCLNRKMPLIEGVLRLGIGVVVVNLGLKFLGLDLTLLANVFMSMFFVPVLFKIVYDIPFGCSLLPPFIFPVCLMDDVLPIFNMLFGRHIAWPPALLVSGSRTTVTIPNAFGASKTVTTLTKDQVVDCVAVTQLYDGARYVLWALEAYVPMWRRKVPLVTTLLSTQSDLYNLITMYQGVPHSTLVSPVYTACAGTMFPVLFPTLALLILFLVFGVGVIHIILVVLKHLFRAVASGIEAMTSYFETAKNELAEEDEEEDEE